MFTNSEIKKLLMIRKKTKFEKLFSFIRYRRRFGAKNLASKIDLDTVKQKSIKVCPEEEKVYTHGSSNEISKHIRALRSEFSGESELCFTIAKIIVLIRREYKTTQNFRIFEEIWIKETDFLLKNLNTRWLIASSDTFSDNSNDSSIREISIACNVFLNTIKLYESERFLNDSDKNKDNVEKQKQLDNNLRFPLFDGVSVFKFGTDDTLRNMRWRIDKIAKKNIAGRIFKEIYDRAQSNNTVFYRAKNRHKRNKTKWWD